MCRAGMGIWVAGVSTLTRGWGGQSGLRRGLCEPWSLMLLTGGPCAELRCEVRLC